MIPAFVSSQKEQLVMQRRHTVLLVIVFMFAGCAENTETGAKAILKRLMAPNVSTATRLELASEIGTRSIAPYTFCEVYFNIFEESLPFDCWNDDGYVPERSQWREEVQLAWVGFEAHLQISNGGLKQFFYNTGGERAPELIVWLKRIGESEFAAELSECVGSLPGSVRVRSERIAWLATPGVLDKLEALSNKAPLALIDEGQFDLVSVAYLRTIGISTLVNRPWAR